MAEQAFLLWQHIASYGSDAFAKSPVSVSVGVLFVTVWHSARRSFWHVSA